jgi:hypothetical protein
LDNRKRAARLAGALYWVAGLPAPFVLLYVPGKVMARASTTATADNVRDHQALIELNIVAHLWHLVFMILLTMALYRLLSPVGKDRAALMVVLFLVSLPLSFLGLLADVGMLVLVRGGDALFAAFDRAQIDALVFFLLTMRGKAFLVAQVFWGLWLLPLGMLVMRSRFLPRLLGVLLIPNGIAYPILSLSGLFLPRYADALRIALLPLLLGEVWLGLWLVIRGTKDSVEGGDPRPTLASGAPVSSAS